MIHNFFLKYINFPGFPLFLRFDLFTPPDFLKEKINIADSRWLATLQNVLFEQIVHGCLKCSQNVDAVSPTGIYLKQPCNKPSDCCWRQEIGRIRELQGFPRRDMAQVPILWNPCA